MKSFLVTIIFSLIGCNIIYGQISKPDIIGPSAGTHTVDNIQIIWRLGVPPLKLEGQESENPLQSDQWDLGSINNSIDPDNFISVTPNPFSSTVYIGSDQEISDNSRIIIINVNGIKVKEILLQQAWFLEQIDLSDLSNGIYSLVVYNHNNQIISSSKISKIQ